MTALLNLLIKKLIRVGISLLLGILLITSPLVSPAQAGRSLMSGDYVNDTILVSQKLQDAILIDPKDPSQSESQEEALNLITDYISRYRNRPQVNGTISFTTMQTALNAMAGHYKNFANRPLPEKLKERLNKELSDAERLVSRES
tara:strand:- start:351 stop:785 length:435 start_codon:yes stop_codon:yes gene_type:complete